MGNTVTKVVVVVNQGPKTPASFVPISIPPVALVVGALAASISVGYIIFSKVQHKNQLLNVVCSKKYDDAVDLRREQERFREHEQSTTFDQELLELSKRQLDRSIELHNMKVKAEHDENVRKGYLATEEETEFYKNECRQIREAFDQLTQRFEDPRKHGNLKLAEQLKDFEFLQRKMEESYKALFKEPISESFHQPMSYQEPKVFLKM
jgi:hypothetical protein